MFKDSDEGGESPPGDSVENVLDDHGVLGSEDDDVALDDAGIDALLEVNGVGGSSASTSEPSAPRSPGPSSSTAPPKDAVTPQKLHQEAAMLMMQGKRHLLVRDVHSAVNSYQEACRIMDETYGQMAPQCGDAYLQYGQALLELARMENGVLGGAAAPEDDEDEEEDEEEEGEQKVEEMQPEAEEQEEDLEASVKEESTDKGKGPAIKKNPRPEDNPKAGEGDAQDEPEDEEDGNPEEEEDVSNLQLAWEMLELAKIVFLKDPKGRLKAADCYLTLGEVSLESEAYDAAVDDFEKCLEIQKKDLEEDDRCIAETYYQLGLTHSFSKNYSDARLNFRHALKVLESRVKRCKGIVEAAVAKATSRITALKEEKIYKAQTEAEELLSLLPEIRAKYEDARDMEAEHSEASQAVREASENLHRSPAKAGSSSSAEPRVAARNSVAVAAGSKDIVAESVKSTFSSKPVSSSFTMPFPREDEETNIVFGSRPTSSDAKAISVRRNLDVESSSSSSSFTSTSFPSSSLSASTAVNDISSLVRRKRKTDESSSLDKPATNGVNGDSLTNGDAMTNGVKEEAHVSFHNGSGSSKKDDATPTTNGDSASSNDPPEAKRVKISEAS